MNILEARRRVIGGEVYKKTAEGNPVSVRSLARMRPGLKLFGRSEQFSTTGAQLLDVVNTADADLTVNGVTITNNSDGSFTISGTPTNTGGYVCTYYVAREMVLEDGQYVLTSGLTVRISKKDGTLEYKAGVFTFNSETDELISIYIQRNLSNYIDGEIVRPMLNKGSTAKPWEPYTGGQPSPSPDYPQEIMSVGDNGSIEVSVSDGAGQNQFLTVQTPNGLPGIPVTSGGNYTDENGQQWICDEIDFKRGKYVQRIHVVNAKNRSWSDGWNLVFPDETGKTHVFNVPTEEYNVSQHAMSNVFFNRDIANSANVNVFTTRQGNGGIGVRVYSQLASTLEEWNAYINSHDVIFALALKEQGYVETPLSPSELAAYAALRTYSPTTVVSNDAGAWMKLGYKTKKSLEVTD